jgi:hypothetical protein
VVFGGKTVELYNSRESTFVEFCVDGINVYVENNFIDSLGLGWYSNPDPSALKSSEYYFAIDLLLLNKEWFPLSISPSFF